MRRHALAAVFLAWTEDEAVGVAICFRLFSTFAGRPLINIHDIAVDRAYRGRGIGTRLLNAVEDAARKSGCCKVTLEVHDSNSGAKRLYRNSGFGPWDPMTLFVTKPL